MRPSLRRSLASCLPVALAALLGGCLSNSGAAPTASGAAAPSLLQRDDEDGRTLEVSAGVGILGAGKTEAEDVTHVTDSEIYGRISIDSFDENNEVGFGVFVDTGTIDYGTPAGDATFGTLGVAVKGRYFDFELGEDVDLFLTPGLGLGYRVDTEGGDGLALNFGIDVRARFAGFDLFVEPGVLTQPVGSDAGREQTFRPLPYALFGVGVTF